MRDESYTKHGPCTLVDIDTAAEIAARYGCKLSPRYGHELTKAEAVRIARKFKAGAPTHEDRGIEPYMDDSMDPAYLRVGAGLGDPQYPKDRGLERVEGNMHVPPAPMAE